MGADQYPDNEHSVCGDFQRRCI